MTRALIFDMDGILIDSMPHHVKTINRVFGAVGIHLDEQTIYDMEGSRTVDIVTHILKRKTSILNLWTLKAFLHNIRRNSNGRPVSGPLNKYVRFCHS
ncbi:HAD hydrolase-like protein [Methanohalophilus profundi]|uniref:HAD hydrolase-like protein n=1 Tax=Methanohalophilus profundi TaxID=2138083 RepID=UPI00101BBD3F|nr:HAD hydrolase-like protein [Methanohalophilus profundi]